MSYEALTLALLKLRGVGPRTVHSLWRKCPAMQTEADLVAALNGFGSGKSPAGWNPQEVTRAVTEAFRTLEQCERDAITVLGPRHPDFPPQLCEIPNPPLLLFAIGHLGCLRRAGVAVIGTREPTEFGLRSARKIASGLAEDGWVIVSGLAEGCDTAGHEGCLSASGSTVAFLAGGFGRIYPASNKDLARRISEANGCLVTEYPPGQPPSRGSFVERDRLQSGLSLGIIVVETDVKGGTMHTVRHATEQGRSIATLLHPAHLRHKPKVQGNLYLIAQGTAIPLSDRNDVNQFASSLRQKVLQRGTPNHWQHDQGELNVT